MYEIKERYVSNFQFNTKVQRAARLTPEDYNVRAIIHYAKQSGYYEVNIYLSVTSRRFYKVEGEFNMSMCYTTHVTLDDCINDNDKARILAHEVPSVMYDYMRTMVSLMFSASCYGAVILGDFEDVCCYDDDNEVYLRELQDWVDKKDRGQTEHPDSNDDDDDDDLEDEFTRLLNEFIEEEKNNNCASEDDALNMDDEDSDADDDLDDDNDIDRTYWLIEYVRSIKDGEEDYREFKYNIRVFNELKNHDLYTHFLQFFKPIPFNHPEVEGYTPEVWDLLYRLLFAVGIEVAFVDSESGLPDIEFYDFEKGEKRLVSSLSGDELDTLLVNLVADACSYFDNFRSTMLFVLGGEKNLCYDLMPKSNFFDMFCCTCKLDVEILEALYKRLQRGHMATFPYRFLNGGIGTPNS